jgi:hypothetical protein
MKIEQIAIDWKDFHKPDETWFTKKYDVNKIKNLLLELLEIEKQKELTVNVGVKMKCYLETLVPFFKYNKDNQLENLWFVTTDCKVILKTDFSGDDWKIEYKGIQLLKNFKNKD